MLTSEISVLGDWDIHTPDNVRVLGDNFGMRSTGHMAHMPYVLGDNFGARGGHKTMVLGDTTTSSNLTWWIVGAVVLAAAVGGAYYYYTRKNAVEYAY